MTDEDVMVIVMAAPLFHKLLEGQRGFRTAAFHLFAQRLKGFMQLVDEITFHKLDQRLAGFLARYGPEINQSHQEIADELGSVREVVSRRLKQFEERNRIRISRKQIEIIERQKLEDYAADAW